MSRVVGIDFGTTKTVAAVMEDKYPTVIPDRNGRQFIPSVVLVSDNQDFFVGWEAIEHPGRYKDEYISINSIKRALGGRNDRSWGWLKHHPQAVAALILGRLKLELEHQFGEEVNRAVIAIPAHFDINERWAVKQAAQIAGFEVMRMLNEATAAALTFNVRHRPQDQTMLVLDFGGGTLDASLLELGEGFCEVKATAGDGLLGGDDFDKLITDHILDSVRKEVPGFKDWSPLQNAMVREAAVRAKIELSATESCQIYLPGLVETGTKSYHHVDLTIKRQHFELMSKELLTRTENVVNRVVKDANVKIDEVLLIGGTSRIPAVRELVRKTLGRASVIGVDPLTCVAEGASVLGAILSGNAADYFLMDTYPNSLSVSTKGGMVTHLIERNTTIPTRHSEIFSTNKDNQTYVDIPVYEGERPMAADNFKVGSVTLFGIPPAPRGVPQIEVTFDIDGNGILNVSAEDKSTGRSAKATMVAPSRLPDDQVKIIQGIVSMEMQKIRDRFTREAEKEQRQRKQKEALDCVETIQSLLERKEQLSVEQVSTLRGGRAVIKDYLDREAPIVDLQNLLKSLRGEVDKALGSNVARHVRYIFEDPKLAPWVDSAIASLDGHKSFVESMREFEALFGLPHVNSIKADLYRASSAANVCDRADAELQDSIGARYCLGFVVSYFAGHVPLVLDPTLPADVEREAKSLLRLFLISELSRDKPRKRRVAAAGGFANICRFEHLIPLLGPMAQGDDQIGEKLLERLRKVSSEDFYQYFRSIEPEKRVAHFSDQYSRARLRDSLFGLLYTKGTEEKRFILLSLSGIIDESCTPALLDALATPNEDDDVQSVMINLLPRRDARAINPLLKLMAAGGPSAREAALTALDSCRDLMNDEWSKGLSSQEWYEYYRAAPPTLRDDWRSKAGVRRTMRAALCEVLPEKTVDEQMSILDAVEWMAGAKSVVDYLRLLPKLDQVEPCCRLISMLASLRDKQIVEPLIRLLSDERPEVRKTAGEALAGCKDLLDSDTSRFIKITSQVMEHGWPPSLSDRFFFSRYMKRHGEWIDLADRLKQRKRA